MSTTVDQALYACLNAHAGLGNLIGTSTDMKLYPVEAPPGTAAPLLVYQVIATDPATTHGEGVSDERLDGHLVQLTALGSTQQVCAGMLYQARLALEASATLKAVQTDERQLPRAEEADVHGRSADFRLWNKPDE